MIAITLLAALLLGSSDLPDSSLKPRTDRYLLSVGVDEYPGLGSTLNGAVNDVQLITERLKKLGFDDVERLENGKATGKAIRAHWDALVAKLDRRPKDAPPAWVVFHFSGHGSQVPDQPPGHPDHDEKDGLDETLVPSDALPQDYNLDIRDDEVFHFVERVTRNGRAKILVILDCCHSGSGARGQTQFRIYRREGLQRSETTDQAAGEVFDERTLPAGSVLLSACRAVELEPEYYDSSRKKYFGLLSCFFDQMLEQERLISRISNSMLRDAIEHRYLEAGVYEPPTPQVEASPAGMLQDSFLSLGPDVDRKPYFIVEAESGGLGQMDAGVLQDVTKGSIYRAYNRPEDVDAAARDGSKSFTWLRVEEVNGPISKVKGVKGYLPADATTTVAWPADAKRLYAVETVHMPGDFVLRVKVVQALRCDKADWADSAPLAANALPPAISGAFKYEAPPDAAATRSIEDRKGGWLRLVSGADEPADLLLRYSGEYAALFPLMGLARELSGGETRSLAPACLRGGWGPVDLQQPDAPDLIRDYLKRITRTRNLLRLAPAGSDRNLHVHVELLEVLKESKGIPTESRPWPQEQADPRRFQPMRPNRMYALRLVNEGQRDVYVTAIVVQPNQQIDVMFPHQLGGNRFDENRLSKGKPVVSDIFRCEPPFGSRTLAYLITDEPHNFSFVQQPKLPVVRSAGVDNLQLPPVGRTPVSTRAGGGTLGDALLGEMGFRDDRIGISVADPSWSSGYIRWLSVDEPRVPDKADKKP